MAQHVAVTLTGEMFLGADRVAGTEGTVQGIDPRTGDPLEPTYGLGSRADVARAAAVAAEAFGIYRETGPKERADLIEQVADNIDALGDELVERVQLETGIVEVDGERLAEAHELYLREGLGARDDAAAMQYLVPGWTFDPKRPALRREGTTP